MQRQVPNHKVSIKRNNPGNIRHTALRWQGEITAPGEAFCNFSSLEMGCRAMLKLLRRYINVKRLNTIRNIIAVWAPPSDSGNNTSAYIDYVARSMDVHPDDTISADRDTLIALASAMTRVEHRKSVPHSVWLDAYRLL